MTTLYRKAFYIVMVVLVAFRAPDSTFAQSADQQNLIAGSDFQADSDVSTAPQNFSATGDVVFGPLGNLNRERFGCGYRFLSARDAASATAPAGQLSTTVRGLTPSSSRWYRFRVRALVQNGFDVDQEDLYLKAEFFANDGKDYLDNISQQIYNKVVLDRQNLADDQTNKNLGPSTWRSYDMEFRTPFPQVDTLRLSIGFGMGKGVGKHAELWVGQEELTPIAVPLTYVAPKGGHVFLGKDLLPLMVPLGGRWYYDPRGASPTPPSQFDYTNSNRLFYLSDRLEAPFADNMSSWLRKGDIDVNGNLATRDVPVADNVTVSFTSDDLVIRSKNLPNHPTAVFPDTDDLLDGNPNYIVEKESTWYIPLNPTVNPNHWAMENNSDSNRALPMGPIGVAVNGIVFFNPFDAGQKQALWRVDRCCGHPGPDGTYHYHKYPVCVKTPWADDGDDHSPLIGFAFDGFPIYGPYEAKGVLAKDDTANPLNAFNIHYDKDRGWHYHVTPGAFPHIIGGYWGYYNQRDQQHGPPGMQ